MQCIPIFQDIAQTFLKESDTQKRHFLFWGEGRRITLLHLEAVPNWLKLEKNPKPKTRSPNPRQKPKQSQTNPKASENAAKKSIFILTFKKNESV